MALLLNIDCATNDASVCLSIDGVSKVMRQNGDQKEHAAFLQVAIKDLFVETGVSLNDIDAVSVTSGPGSYTGLRVGMASAKGICYALSKPLITLSTLEVMASAAKLKTAKNNDTLLCPMIDARRMEVFTAIYNENLEPILVPCAIEVTPLSFRDILEKNSIYIFGSGSEKCKDVLVDEHVKFMEVSHSAKDAAILAEKSFQEKRFADVAYAEPLYLKEFYSTSKV